MLAQAELIKAAAEKQFEAQRLYTEAANLQSESKEVLDQARAKVSKESLFLDLMPRHQPPMQTSTPEANTSWLDDHVDSQSPENADIDWHGEFEPQSVPELTPDTIPAELDSKDLLLANELVLGLEHGQQSRGYPITMITQRRVINDTIGELDILVTFGPPSELGMMFNRNMDGRSLTFEPITKVQNGRTLMKNQETGTIMEALTGHAISRPLCGGKLTRLNLQYSFWFARSQLHTGTEVYPQG